ncbi:peptidoglycan-binding protein [Streptomyces tirandamycinicus]|uniref:N-acetylmuramoyl-L-alanine amidase n=1 Tax=Streptomyces tirandamycinicus TaxID=2174846 RepID=A0A2S1T1Z7_9ACTN|nr:peptidoglycan-binding protein [Streptomyces tirandamycinicus]AWI32668.1 N-acetylmuramoyl-L-alanine amidase [Streptomyces tirandamycinicus]
MTVRYYPGASRAYDFSDRFKGADMDPDKVGLHTTEGTSLVDYAKGANAPNITAKPNFGKSQLDWYQHYPFDQSARALVNKPGGVETNTDDIVQVELIGTCDPKHRKTWGKLQAGVHYIYWPEAPDWALDDLAEFLAWQHVRNGVPLSGPTEWPAYPSSYGATSARMTHDEWRAFKGICGHLHAPENSHGDPGNIPFARIVAKAKAKAKGMTGGGKPKPPASGGGKPRPKPVPPFPGRDKFGPGKSNGSITLLGHQLVRKGFGKHYTSGPGPRWSDADRKNVEAFQRSRNELRGDADGLPGPLTWKLLFS